MVRPKVKKQIDFKKIKRKLGRKLPPPKNGTNTEIKSKAIILPEQNVATAKDKSDFATNKKVLTLKELQGRISHPNAKIRKSALLGMEDLFKRHPAELQSNKFSCIHKIKGLIGDDDKQVRKALYTLFQTRIFPYCKEDNQGLLVSLLMPSIFLAMVHSSIDVRLMAFEFLHLVVDLYPPTFSLYAEKILKNYKDIISQLNHFYVQDKSNLKVALSGLAHCLSLLPCHGELQEKALLQNETLFAYEQDAPNQCVRFAHVSGRLKEIVGALVNCFQDFLPLIKAPRGSDAQSLIDCVHHILCSIYYAIKFSVRRYSQRQTSYKEVGLMKLDQDITSMLSKKLLGSFPLNPGSNLSGRNDESYFILNGVLTEIFLEVSEGSHLPSDLSCRFLEFIEKALLGKITRSLSEPICEKTLLALLPFVPKLILRVDSDWRDNLLQAFTITLSDCNLESPLKLACISVVRDLIIPNGNILSLDDPTVINYHRAWVDKLPSLLNQLGDKHPVSTQVVLQLILDLGRVGCLKNASSTFQEDIRNFFTPYQGEGDVPGGPFASLPREAQDLALSFLYYFTIENFSSPLLSTIVLCCLYQQLEPDVLYRIVEVLQIAYREGYIPITDQMSFLVTLIARFRVFPRESAIESGEQRKITFQELTKLVSSCLSQMGDSSAVLRILEKVLVEQIPALDNGCSMLRVICELDTKPTRLSENSVTALSEFLPGYLIDIVNCIPEDKEKSSYLYIQTCFYYLVPCYFLFDRSSKLTEKVLKRMRMMVGENTNALLESLVQQDRESSRKSLNLIQCTVSVILLMHNDVRATKIISAFKSEIDLILQNVITLQSSSLSVEGKHMMKIAGERLKIASDSLLSCTTVAVE